MSRFDLTLGHAPVWTIRDTPFDVLEAVMRERMWPERYITRHKRIVQGLHGDGLHKRLKRHRN